MTDPPKRTDLNQMHRDLGAKMVPFAGYDMPVQYDRGILHEHHHTRSKASLFDVGHMGQAELWGDDAARALETLVPGDITGLAAGQIRYTQLTNEAGGIIDDLMVTNRGDHLFLVVNAGCKENDYRHIQERIGERVDLKIIEDRGLVALQGPAAAGVLSRFAPGVEKMAFMTMTGHRIDGADCLISRSGYTGEDGYEISLANDHIVDFVKSLLACDEVAPAGLGARDTLRLEAGLCLHGHDIDETTSPVEAGLTWSIGKNRRESGGFLGHRVILDQLANGPRRKKICILPKGKAPARDHTVITEANGSEIGSVTSGGFGPTVGGPIAMGYVTTEYGKVGSEIGLIVRGKNLSAEVVRPPFVAHQYFRG